MSVRSHGGQSGEGHDIRFAVGFAISCPLLHELAPLLKQVTTPISGLGLVADRMRQRLLADLLWERCGLTGPIAEAAAEAMNSDVVSVHAPQLHRHRHPRERLARGSAREDEIAGARLL